MTCTRPNEGRTAVWHSFLFYFSLVPPPPQIILYPCCSLRGLQDCRPLTVEVWISCHVRVRAQQKSRTLVLKRDHFQLPHLNTHTLSPSLPHTHTRTFYFILTQWRFTLRPLSSVLSLHTDLVALLCRFKTSKNHCSISLTKI